MPVYGTEGAAGFDISYLPGRPEVDLVHGEPLILETGLSFEVPEGHVMLIFSRSGQGFKYDIRLANCVGVIDSDYRGEIKVKLARDRSDHYYGSPITIHGGDRIAQCIILPYPAVKFVEVDELSDTVRGANGYGSTGYKPLGA